MHEELCLGTPGAVPGDAGSPAAGSSLTLSFSASRMGKEERGQGEGPRRAGSIAKAQGQPLRVRMEISRGKPLPPHL